MTILTPIASILTILAYFALSVFMPILGYLVPSYKIKKVNIFGSRYRLIVNFSVAIILYILDIKILILYIIYPFLTEFLFYFTLRFITKIKTFDRIVLMSLISTLIIVTIVYYNRVYIENLIEEAINTSKTLVNMDIKEVYATFIYLKRNFLSSIFSYLFIGNIFLFLTLSPSTYEKWKISAYWLLPFMLIIISNKLLGINSSKYLSENIITISRYIYTWYGVKTIYLLSGKIKIKFNLLRHALSIILGITYPLPVFILGALASFEVVEVKTI
ncbi:hypothetical protein [Fusobacterium russii]|uniref:hypothetical protein n=1 Tax=Fusobacterium russii TaxID=854 RepID=UPI00039A5E41|nr:hypothetical protein [Fusobacterium russii]